MRRALPSLLALAAACGTPSGPRPPSVKPVVIHDVSSIRRVCKQMGLGRAGTGGGSIVFLTGVENGDFGIDTLRGDHFVAHGATSLCPVTEQSMRVCPADAQHTAHVRVEDAFEGPSSQPGAESGARVARGAPLGFYEYVSGGGATRAIVNVEGKARFISADEVCHLENYPPVSRSTEAFRMNTSVPAGPKAFRPRSIPAIKRIVIHNTEVNLRETLHHFGRVEANTSAHVVIDRDGAIYRVVEDQFSAFHAGSSKDAFGGHNATSLGIEVVAFDDTKYGGEAGTSSFFSDAQREAVIRLVDFWMTEYNLEIDDAVLQNRTTTEGYADLEYRQAAVTIHRLTKADRGTDCPRLLFSSSLEGDEAFFRWREATFSRAERMRRDAPITTGVAPQTMP